MLQSALLGCLLLMPPPQTQLQKVSPLTVRVKSTVALGTLARGERNELWLQFKGGQKHAKIRILRRGPSGVGARQARPQNVVAHEETVNLYSGNMLGGRSATLLLPLVFRNGAYMLDAEIEGIGKSPAISISVVDPPTKILAMKSPKSVGGTLSMTVNYAPEGCRLAVTRLENAPFPEEWWAPYKSVAQSTSLLLATRTVNANGTMQLSGTLPVKLGAGKFRARVQGGTALLNSEYRTFSFKFPYSSPPVYTLRYESIECVVETDEVGDDEMYTLHIVGETVKKNSPRDGHVQVKLHGPQGMSEGRKRSANFDIDTFETLESGISLLWAVALLENDDGNPAAYRYQVEQAAWYNIMREPFNGANVGGLINGAISEYRKRQSGNSDEYLGWRSVPIDIDQDLRHARRNQGWHPRSVTFEEDGGKYVLTFSISASPKSK